MKLDHAAGPIRSAPEKTAHSARAGGRSVAVQPAHVSLALAPHYLLVLATCARAPLVRLTTSMNMPIRLASEAGAAARLPSQH